jgi:predicted ATPase
VFVHALIGADLGAARDVAVQLEEIAGRRGDPGDELMAATCMGTTLFHLGDLPRAHALLQWVLPARGWALAHLGRGDEGVAQLRACLDAHRAVSARLEVPYFLGLLADALLHLGRPAEAEEALREALAVVDATGQRFYEAELHRLCGVARLALGGAEADRAAAAASFETARTLAHRIEASYLADRAERSLAELRATTGRP